MDRIEMLYLKYLSQMASFNKLSLQNVAFYDGKLPLQTITKYVLFVLTGGSIF